MAHWASDLLSVEHEETEDTHTEKKERTFQSICKCDNRRWAEKHQRRNTYQKSVWCLWLKSSMMFAFICINTWEYKKNPSERTNSWKQSVCFRRSPLPSVDCSCRLHHQSSSRQTHIHLISSRCSGRISSRSFLLRCAKISSNVMTKVCGLGERALFSLHLSPPLFAKRKRKETSSFASELGVGSIFFDRSNRKWIESMSSIGAYSHFADRWVKFLFFPPFHSKILVMSRTNVRPPPRPCFLCHWIISHIRLIAPKNYFMIE